MRGNLVHPVLVTIVFVVAVVVPTLTQRAKF